ncbi:MAG: tail fiber protein [Bacilli bacterium]|nr:tail fiber protein [Bacilli bacterium]
MSKRKDKVEVLLNQFKEEQNKFKVDLENKLREEQKKNIEKQNKKIKRIVYFAMFFCLFLSSIASVFSYSFGASSVAYTPTDSNWKVANTQEAIDDLFDSVGSALVGSVYSYMGTTSPHGYLACDGSVYKISDYERLANHINVQFGSYNFFGGDGETTFAVPDLRGEFLRGTGVNSHTNQGSGASVGTHQDATYNPNFISLATGWNVVQFPRTINEVTNVDTYINTSPGHANINISSSGSNTGNVKSTNYTSRPTNTSVLYIIKY